MILNTERIKIRAEKITAKLNAYAAEKKLNEEQHLDVIELREELESLRRIVALEKREE